jgi:hypothetical protein
MTVAMTWTVAKVAPATDPGRLMASMRAGIARRGGADKGAAASTPFLRPARFLLCGWRCDGAATLLPGLALDQRAGEFADPPRPIL